MPDFSLLAQQIAIWAVPVICAITVPQVIRGHVALRLGDDTAQRLGMLSLNPIRHVDPVGTLLVPAVLLLLKAPFLFGWPKPVPVDATKFRSPLRDMALVSAAVLVSNLAMAFAWAALVAGYVAAGQPEGGWTLVRDIGVAGVVINVVLVVVGLIPVPPFDGGRIVAALLPAPLARPLARLEPWGFLIVVVLIVIGVLGPVLALPMSFLEALIYRSIGLTVTEP